LKLADNYWCRFFGQNRCLSLARVGCDAFPHAPAFLSL
jgi:hypothetical protein